MVDYLKMANDIVCSNVNYSKLFIMCDIIDFVENNDLDITIPKPEYIDVMEYVYDVYCSNDFMENFNRLVEIVCNNWIEIKEDTFTDNDVINEYSSF